MTTDQASQDLMATFRQSMSRLAANVVVVTSRIDGRPWGMTVSACCSVSMTPPLLLVALGKESASVYSIRADGRFGVSILGERSVEVARFGAAAGQPKFIDHFVHPDGHSSNSPVVVGAPAHVDCRVVQEIEAGDHVIFLGCVEDVALQESDLPLLYFSRSYHSLAPLDNLGVGPEDRDSIDTLLRMM